ncbi:hypothetical protein [Herbiconiux sp. VKM Ac-2851]|uniref:hypothetical protein n=1 Tax=Herbiconiux sp. VKM Ac-2851 TaxID=2739025 RepID=UPI001567C62C|nr:hypothetical protein [Herbiconiux sp. VKM Ac-2851]NQX35265.1 hypothetical protein [Herbiconiux sp. VKM Ac-2851]
MTPTSPAPHARAGVDRRTALSIAAWSVPVIAVAVATPAFAASSGDLGAFTLRGSCGVPGAIGPGFTLTAATEPLPVGTVIIITGSGVGNIGVFSVSGGQATVTTLSGTSRYITLTAALPAGATMAFRSTLSTSVMFQLNAVVSLPAGYTATGAKTAANVNSGAQLCTAS